jgi:hypothetical protein
MGFPTVKYPLTKAVIAQIVVLVGHGLTVNRIIEYIKVPRNIFDAWVFKGKKANGDIYEEFYTEYKKAQAMLQENLIARIMAEPDWRASAWLLERRFAREFGKKDHVTIAPESYNERLKREESINVDNLSIEECMLINQLIVKAGAGVNVTDAPKLLESDQAEPEAKENFIDDDLTGDESLTDD